MIVFATEEIPPLNVLIKTKRLKALLLSQIKLLLLSFLFIDKFSTPLE